MEYSWIEIHTLICNKDLLLAINNFKSFVEQKIKFIDDGIKTHFDDYDCWISKNQHFEITEKTYGELLSAPLVLSDDLVQVVQEGSTYLPIVMGSTLPLFKDGELKIENRTFLFDGKWIEPADINKGKILEYAFMYLNAPYLWGGKSPFGIDCSGFTQMVYKLCGYNLPRDAYLAL